MSEETTVIPVTIKRDTDKVTIDMDPAMLVELKEDDSIGLISISIGGTVVAHFQRFTVAEKDQMEAAERDQATGQADRLANAIGSALYHSVDKCAGCKVCENQIVAVMDVLGYEPDV